MLLRGHHVTKGVTMLLGVVIMLLRGVTMLLGVVTMLLRGVHHVTRGGHHVTKGVTMLLMWSPCY